MTAREVEPAAAYVDGWTCDACREPVGCVLSSSEDGYGAERERLDWIETWIEPDGARLCADCHNRR